MPMIGSPLNLLLMVWEMSSLSRSVVMIFFIIHQFLILNGIINIKTYNVVTYYTHSRRAKSDLFSSRSVFFFNGGLFKCKNKAPCHVRVNTCVQSLYETLI